MKILVVEDDKALAVGVSEGLRNSGYEVLAVASGQAAVTHTLGTNAPDLVLLDLGLPDMDGNDVCRLIREQSSVPILVISARDDEIDRVIGLELGADDYITKPFGIRELVARIKAVSRRMNPAGSDRSDVQKIGALTIDRRAQRVFVADVETHLTATEFELLSVLAEDPGAVYRRTELLERIWDTALYVTPKTVDAHIAAIRKKLQHPEWIESKRGVGFRLAVTG